MAQRAGHLREEMDDPGCDRERLFNTFRQFARVNRLFSRWHRLYADRIRPFLRRRNAPGRLLDIGCGGGDIPLALWQWARRDGLELDVTGIDADQRAMDFLHTRDWPAGFHFRQATAGDLVRESAAFDLIISNNLLHHLDDSDRAGLLADTESLSRGLVIFNDIERSALAYALFALVMTPFFRRSFVVPDGLTSIRRSYTADELRRSVPPGWCVRRVFPYRLILEHPDPAP
jgi:2-polyprenyl-3-methyl-5-hydroxy-6-metoxy-1,4-benzoquinol methylase